LPAVPGRALLVDGGSVAAGATGTGTEFSFAEGTTREGFQEYVTVLNPSTGEEKATLTWDIVDATTGSRSRRADHLTLPPGRTTVDVNRAVGAGADVSVGVDATAPVVVERPMYFAATLPGLSGDITGGSTVLGSQPATAFRLAEGTTRPGFQEYVTVLNPAPEVRGGHLVYDIVDAATGERRRTTTDAAFLPGRTTVDVNAAVGNERDVSVAVEADGPVAAERPVYFRATLPATGLVGGGSS